MYGRPWGKPSEPPTVVAPAACAPRIASSQPASGTQSASRKMIGSPRLSAAPRLRAPAALPRSPGGRIDTTRAPAARASSAVASVEPSSITRTSISRAAERWLRTAFTTSAMCPASLRAGMTTETSGHAIDASPPADSGFKPVVMGLALPPHTRPYTDATRRSNGSPPTPRPERSRARSASVSARPASASTRSMPSASD